ncbi:MAG: hypothetical protein PWQ77_2027 [Kosmotogales bacterium]|nr:hypothetical protein [Kosmotogales bacterium]
MITVFLLALIYLAFISLGLPDSLIGVTWPAIRAEWGMPLDAAGLITIIVSGNTIISTLMSGYLIKKIGTGKITYISCFLTGGALLGFSFSQSYFWLIILAIPLGFGAGSVDAALNNYVALHFKAHHMNWLHSFWGIGATLGPLIVSATISKTESWRSGFRVISIIQLSLAVVLLFSYPLWNMHQKQIDIEEKKKDKDQGDIDKNTEKKKKKIFRIRGVKAAIATFIFYVATELSVGLWGSSFLVHVKNISIETAATWIAMYYGGITLGRFISGFVSFKLKNTQMIRIGILMALTGTVLFSLPLPDFMLFICLILMGLGLAPIFPSMLHETPRRFGKEYSQTIIGYQMGFGYIGSTFLPPLVGVILENTTMTLFPFFLIAFIILMLFFSESIRNIKYSK